MAERQPYWCFLCQRERSLCGGQDGTCPRVDAEAEAYREAKANGEYKTLFKTRRLELEREYGMSGREMAKEVVDSAKEDGREVVSASSYGDIKPPKRNTPDLRNL